MESVTRGAPDVGAGAGGKERGVVSYELRQRRGENGLGDAGLHQTSGLALVTAFTQWVASMRVRILVLSDRLVCEMREDVHIALHLAWLCA